MEGRESSVTGIISPPSCFNVILQKGLAAQLAGSNSTSLHAPAALRPCASSAMTAANATVLQQQQQQPGSSSILQPMPSNTYPTGEQVKRKRGRPRKYGPHGSIVISMVPSSSASAAPPPASLPQKKGRGRPLGSGKKRQLAALGTAGVGFTPYVITVAAGEDVAMKVMSFSQQQGLQAVCILSANGAISNATLGQPATSGGMVTYEGRFEILSLSGSFLPTANAGITSRTGGLSVSLAGPDGQVLGGGVAGLLMAASPVQVVLGTFLSTDATDEFNAANTENFVNKSQGVNLNATMQHNHNTMGTSVHWPISDIMPDIMRNTDINVSLPGG